MLVQRELLRDEIKQIWTIDRSEVIEAVYSLVDGVLTLGPAFYDMKGWSPGTIAEATPTLEACFDHGGWFWGFFEADKLAGVVVLENRFMGFHGDQLQLQFLHVSRHYRHRGLGKQLFDLAAQEARQRGASRLYISATPSEHTIDFYLRRGCAVTAEPDPALLAMEPEDIHLEYSLR